VPLSCQFGDSFIENPPIPGLAAGYNVSVNYSTLLIAFIPHSAALSHHF